MKPSAELIDHCLRIGLNRGLKENEILSDVDKLEEIQTRWPHIRFLLPPRNANADPSL